MSERKDPLRSIGSLSRDRSGNFGLMTAILLPVLVVSIGVAIDVTNMMTAKAQFQDTIDAAALAAASGMAQKDLEVGEAETLAKTFVSEQFSLQKKNIGLGGEPGEGTTDVTARQWAGSDSITYYEVTVTGRYDLPVSPLTSLFGFTSVPISASSQARTNKEIGKNPLSMYLVLDKSGSMGESTKMKDPANPNRTLTRMGALKLSVQSMLTQLSTADPNQQYVRTGVSVYNDKMQSFTNLAWGTATVSSTVNGLSAQGYTNSSDAVKKAVELVGSDTEISEHFKKNGEVPSRYIIFMTDGENRFQNDDKNSSKAIEADRITKEACLSAHAKGIEVFTIGFMVNVARAKTLLQDCASSPSHYMPAEDADQLVASFKTIGSRIINATTRLTQ